MPTQPPAPPRQPFDRYQVAFARATSIALLAGPLSVGAVLLAAGESHRLIGTLPFAAVGLVAWLLLSRRRLEQAFRVLVFGVWICCAHAMLWSNGVRAPAIAAFVLVILLSGWIAGLRTTIGVTVATVLFLFVMATAEVSGSAWPAHAAVTPFQAAFILTVIMLAAGALGHFAARSLRERVERFEALFHSGPTGTAISEPESGTILECNDAFCRIIGRPREEVVGRTAAELGYWIDLAQRTHAYEVLKREGSLRGYEVRWRTPAGEIRDCLIEFRLLELDGSPRMVAQVMDASALKSAQSALRASEAKFATAFHASPTAVMLTRVEGRLLVEVNGAFERTFGYSRDETIGKRAMALGLWRDDEQRRAIVDDLYSNRPVVEAPLTGIHHDGRVIDCRMTARFVEIAGEPHVLSIVRDVTVETAAFAALAERELELERRVTERTAELNAAMKELDTFAYSVAHDLNTPLRSIHGFASILDEDAADRLLPADRTALRRIREGTARMAVLIADLLTLSRLTRSELKRERVDLTAIASRIAADLSATEPGRNVEWRIAEGLAAQCDKGLAQSLLANLLGNAWKYTRKQPSAVIELGAEPGRAELAGFFVRDNGAGFDNAQANRMFAPFVRLHRDTEFEGNGIGLATVERILNRHGGTVRAQGEPGVGASFHFTLPTAERQTGKMTGNNNPP